MLRCVAQGWFEVMNAEPGQRSLHTVHKPGAFLDQALALPIGPLGVLFGKRRHAHHAAMAPFPSQPRNSAPITSWVLDESRALICSIVAVNRRVLLKMSVSSAKKEKISRAIKWFMSWRR